MNRWVTAGWVASWTVAFASFSSSSSPAAEQSALQQEADQRQRVLEDSEGVVLGQIMGGATEFTAAGRIRADGPAPDEDTLFEIGSITKVFTAILLAEAEREGLVQLSDPVTRFLPPEAVGEGREALDRITLEKLSTHTSGLPRLPANFGEHVKDMANPYAQYPREALYAYLRELTPADLEAGEGEMAYSNLGVALLGHVLERVWDRPLADLMEERIFAPLGMESSFLAVTEADHTPARIERMATPHAGGKVVSYWTFDVSSGAGAIVSTAGDLLRFARAHWDPAEDTPPGLVQSLARVREQRTEQMGLGWLFGQDGVTIAHDGGTGGFASHLEINVEDQTARVSLVNSGLSSIREMEVDPSLARMRGFWEGTLDVGAAQLSLVLHVDPAEGVALYSIDQGAAPLPASKGSVGEDGAVVFVFSAINGSFTGTLDGGTMVGNWTQGQTFPLTLTRSGAMPDRLRAVMKKAVTGDLEPLAGYWSGHLNNNKDSLFIYFRIDAVDGVFRARLFSPDQSDLPIPVTTAVVEADKKIRFDVRPIGGSYEGARTGDSFSGTWQQGGAIMTLDLQRSTEKPVRK